MTVKKRKKSVAKILSSLMLTLLQKKKKVCGMSIEILASKLPMLWVLIGVYHTCNSQLHSFSCPHFIFDVGDGDLPILTSGH